MTKKISIAACCIILLMLPFNNVRANDESSRSSSWSALVHEENSLWASILYLPYLFGQLPMRMMDGIMHPKPASRSTVPPPAHQENQQ